MQLDLLNKVIKGGYCIGCGACTFKSSSPYEIKLDDKGCYQATLKPTTIYDDDIDVAKVCPFYNSELNETVIGRNLYSASNEYDPQIGYYQKVFAGRVLKGDYYEKGSSGGFGKWILYKLLEENLVDYVVQVYSNNDNPDKLFEYKVVSNKESVLNGAKSVYYPVEMSNVLDFIKKNPGRYAITGVPCFIKSIRLLQANDSLFAERIRFCIGIVCGHLKSTYYSKMIGWQLGVEPEQLSGIDFRVKIRDKKANEKGVKATSVNGTVSSPETVQNIFGTNYGHGFFKYNACDYCDDVVGETADVSIGDAWLPQFLNKGTSILIIRNATILNLIHKEDLSSLEFVELSAKEAAESQAAGFRHRRDGLAYRLFLKKKKGEWIPLKRVEASDGHLTFIQKKIFIKRQEFVKLSYYYFQLALKKNNFKTFKNPLYKKIKEYEKIYNINKSFIYKSKVKALHIMKIIGLENLYKVYKNVRTN